jgi:hypothetical protein
MFMRKRSSIAILSLAVSGALGLFGSGAARAQSAPGTPTGAHETIWLEAEFLQGLKGFCWPMAKGTKESLRKTEGNWGLSGPGWAAEWNQGGESGFLSIAAGPGDDKAVVSKTINVPKAGKYYLWVRYGDWRETPERFRIKLKQDAGAEWSGVFGEKPVVEEDNEAKLLYGWAFGWGKQEVNLTAGNLTVTMESAFPDPECRQVDVIVLTTDPAYRPFVKDQPNNVAWQKLAKVKDTAPPAENLVVRATPAASTPTAFAPHTFQNKGFIYLWNTAHGGYNWLTDDPKRVLVPYNLIDPETTKEFEAKYAGRADVPIFGDKRIVPTFHAISGEPFSVDSKDPKKAAVAKGLVKWLDANPDRYWATMMNYKPDTELPAGTADVFLKYRDRYVGSIAGESLGYWDYVNPDFKTPTKDAKTRREMADTLMGAFMDANVKKYQKTYGADYEKVMGKDPKKAFEEVISCMSVGNIVFMPIMAQMGARTIGYESAACTGVVIGMRWAFMRGTARQFNGLTATYRSTNYGDCATVFTPQNTYSKPENMYDNYYSVYSGSGMTWFKFDLWYQYMAGASMFYHEQGFMEWWKPGGTTAAGKWPVELSPIGKLVDRFLRVTDDKEKFDRGTPYTPVAFLLDYAHGWEPSTYWPNSFKNFHGHPEKLPYGDHEKMLNEIFWTAFYPIGPNSEKPMMALTESFVAGTFGDIFDVVFAFPDTKRWTTIDQYPLVVAAGETAITEPEGKRLKEYVDKGGTLVVFLDQFTGPGAAQIGLPKTGETITTTVYKNADGKENPTQTLAFKPITLGNGGKAIATDDKGNAMISSIDQGKGRLIYVSIPLGLSMDKHLAPPVTDLFIQAFRGLTPVSVQGDVQWMLNKNATGWMVTIINPYGQEKPQQGITPTDYRQNRTVTVRSKKPIKSAVDRLLPSDVLTPQGDTLTVTIPAGGVRIIEIKE